jgi:hypothetical protein
MDQNQSVPTSRVGAAAETPTAPTQASNTDRLGLEDIVHLANKIGLEFVTARKESERLELLKNTVRARVSIRLDDGTLTEAKLRRLMETDQEYLDFLNELFCARAESEKLRVRYESYKNLFDARRSLLSYQKAEMKLL